MKIHTRNILLSGALTLAAGCDVSSGGPSGMVKQMSPCVSSALRSTTGVHSNCQAGLNFVSTNLGLWDWNFDIDATRGNDQYRAHAESPSMGAVDVSFDETTNRLSFESQEGRFSVEPDAEPDVLWVRSYSNGDSGEAVRRVVCPGLAVHNSAADPTAAPFVCSDLVQYSDTIELVRQISLGGPKEHVSAVVAVLKDQLQTIAAMQGTPSRGGGSYVDGQGYGWGVPGPGGIDRIGINACFNCQGQQFWFGASVRWNGNP